MSGRNLNRSSAMAAVLLTLLSHDGASQATVREDLRIGEVNSSGPASFHQITAMTVGPGGEIYVANRGSTSIRAFAPDGRFLREFGRQGSGPGEFRLISVLWMSGDSVVAIDWQAGGRVSLFGSRGELLDNWAATNPLDGTRYSLISNSPTGWIASVSGRDPGQDIRIHLLDHRTRAKIGGNVPV
jgi:hypothetical protein